MPAYSTPGPIDLAVNLTVGAIDVVASDRTDTIVTVTATNPTKKSDRRGAEETRIEFDGQRLTVVGPRPRISWIGPNPGDSIDVKVELPTGSRLTAEIAAGGLHATGRLGATRIKSSTGQVALDTTGDAWLRVSHGNTTLDNIDGGIEIVSDFGQIRIGAIAGDAVLKASYGNVQIGESGGDLDAKLSYGDLEIARALASVTAKTAYGNIQLREVSSGSIQVESGYGDVGIGVRPGVSAWLDLSSKYGRVRNQLGDDRAPDPSEQTVAVHARAQGGNLDVYRADR